MTLLHEMFDTDTVLQVYKPTLVRFESVGGLAANSPADVTKGSPQNQDK